MVDTLNFMGLGLFASTVTGMAATAAGGGSVGALIAGLIGADLVRLW